MSRDVAAAPFRSRDLLTAVGVDDYQVVRDVQKPLGERPSAALDDLARVAQAILTERL